MPTTRDQSCQQRETAGTEEKEAASECHPGGHEGAGEETPIESESSGDGDEE
jgi:hypothetical protein